MAKADLIGHRERHLTWLGTGRRAVMRRYLVSALSLAATLAIAPAAAQEEGSAEAGHELASQLCTACHIVGNERSGSDLAPPFPVVAKNPRRVARAAARLGRARPPDAARSRPHAAAGRRHQRLSRQPARHRAARGTCRGAGKAGCRRRRRNGSARRSGTSRRPSDRLGAATDWWIVTPDAARRRGRRQRRGSRFGCRRYRLESRSASDPAAPRRRPDDNPQRDPPAL